MKPRHRACAGLALWLVLAASIYGLAVRAGWLRTRETYGHHSPDERKSSEAK